MQRTKYQARNVISTIMPRSTATQYSDVIYLSSQAVASILQAQHLKSNLNKVYRIVGLSIEIYVSNRKFVINSIMNSLKIYSCVLQLPQFTLEVLEASTLTNSKLMSGKGKIPVAVFTNTKQRSYASILLRSS